MSPRRVLAIAFATAVASLTVPAAEARAQAQPATSVGPTADAVAVGVRLVAAPDADDAALQDARRRNARPLTLMLVGAGGLIVGGFVGDDAGTVISIAGAVVLLYGFYELLQDR